MASDERFELVKSIDNMNRRRLESKKIKAGEEVVEEHPVIKTLPIVLKGMKRERVGFSAKIC